MTIYKIFPEGFAANSYILTADGKRAVVIDPAQPRILDAVKKRGLEVRFVLLTHGHYDHIGGCAALQEAGAKVGCLETEVPLVLGKDNMAREGGVTIAPFKIDFTLKDGEIFNKCGIRARVIATPGHTAGSACFLCGTDLFTGDTLLYECVGRTDLPTGNAEQLRASVKKLYALKGDATIFAGHGEESNLDYEREHNLYIR
ncbi:MAG: MBL fold metallo-hydrolase [Clostridia bacterium]|nr:MBL fold metallo-hydrolase [Clostridia bacterium]